MQQPLDSSHLPEGSHSIPCQGQREIHTAHTLTPSYQLWCYRHKQHPEDGEGVSCSNIGESSHLNAAVCPRTFH